ncbi:endonuclease [bacterium]|nr:endonuclease [bacterium]
MESEEFDRLLLATMQDCRLQSAEIKALDDFLEANSPTDELLAFYRHRVFAIAMERFKEKEAQDVATWIEGVIKRLVPRTKDSNPEVCAAYFSEVDNCVARIVSLIAEAKSSIDICVFTITDDRIAEPLIEAHRQGVSVRILTDDDKANDLGSDIPRFMQEGMPVRVDRTAYHMHHKFAIFDRKLLLTGSYNWTRGASINNIENFILVSDRALLRSFQKEFDRLWEKLS